MTLVMGWGIQNAETYSMKFKRTHRIQIKKK